MTTIFAMLIVAGLMYWFAVLPAEKKAEDLKKELDILKNKPSGAHQETTKNDTTVAPLS